MIYYVAFIGAIFDKLAEWANVLSEWLQSAWEWFLDFLFTYPYLAVPAIGIIGILLYDAATFNSK